MLSRQQVGVLHTQPAARPISKACDEAERISSRPSDPKARRAKPTGTLARSRALTGRVFSSE